MTDRAKLEEAIRHGDERYSGDSYVKLTADHWFTLRAAAEAHLATLPKTKMVEVWHVEFWDREHDEPWVTVCGDKVIAEARAIAIRGEVATCIRVTGPHQQEIPV